MIITILFAGLLLILVAGIRCGFALDDLIRMAVNGIKKAVNVLSVLAIVGILTAMWRADGTIAYIVSSAAGLFKPSILIVTIFLMNCLVSFMTGTSFGTAATMGVISMTIAGTAGVNPVISGGAVISGCFFGDRCSPLSSSAILVASVTDTNLFDNIRNMLRTAAVPFVLTCIIYGAIGLGGANQVDAASISDVFAKEFQLNRWMILPAVIVLGLSMLRVDVKQSMTLSIVCAVILCVLYKAQENSQRAVDLEDSAVLISALIPWSIAGAVPAATIGAPVYCLAAACYLYLIPICRLVRKKNIFLGCNN